MEGGGEACSLNHPSTVTEAPVAPPNVDPQSTKTDSDAGSQPALNRIEILKALEVVERDSVAIAESFTSLFASLRLALSEVTSSSVDHLHCFGDAVGHLQESVLDAATKGNRYINSCLRLNEEMKGIDSLVRQLYPFCEFCSCSCWWFLP
uniref:Uncharacterized protein LOC8287383 isoform X2 n=1 Tax=Rhizophora mucronata TaxID=61149 RepID=A0A2P2JG41_RHIMU